MDVVKSTTWEEATAKVGPWIRQRTRWIKGYMLTAAVNLRRPLLWFRRNGFRGLVTMLGLILGTPMCFLFYPLALGFTVASWAMAPIVQIFLPEWLLIFGTVNMIGFNFLMVVVSGAAAWRRYNWRIAAFAVFIPVYWLLHSYAAWRAAVQVVRPRICGRRPRTGSPRSTTTPSSTPTDCRTPRAPDLPKVVTPPWPPSRIRPLDGQIEPLTQPHVAIRHLEGPATRDSRPKRATGCRIAT